jgi:hypothetical protein
MFHPNRIIFFQIKIRMILNQIQNERIIKVTEASRLRKIKVIESIHNQSFPRKRESNPIVIPAKAGIHRYSLSQL